MRGAWRFTENYDYTTFKQKFLYLDRLFFFQDKTIIMIKSIQRIFLPSKFILIIKNIFHNMSTLFKMNSDKYNPFTNKFFLNYFYVRYHELQCIKWIKIWLLFSIENSSKLFDQTFSFNWKIDISPSRLLRAGKPVTANYLLDRKRMSKELSLCHKFSFCKTYIFATLWCKLLIFQTYIIWSNSIHSLKY